MSHTLALHPVKKRDAIFLWVLLGWLAFALLPSWSLDYGLLESTREEILTAYGWSFSGFRVGGMLAAALLMAAAKCLSPASAAEISLAPHLGEAAPPPLQPVDYRLD